MAKPPTHEWLQHLQEKGLLTDDQARDALRLLQQAARDGEEVPLPEVLRRVGVDSDEARNAAAVFDAAEDTADSDDLTTPDIRASGLTVLERVGRGSQGIVYKCRQAVTEREVAVKILLPSAAGDAESRARFIREAKAAAQLSHPNIVTVHEIRPLKDTICIVMEYIDGGSVKDLLEVRRRFQPSEAVLIVRQVAEALNAAHTRAIIHRDVKPSNIMLTSEGMVKLADMGLARHAEEADEEEGKAYGTPYYISPEQVTGDPPPDHRTDLYSLGVVLFEMVAGRRPFMAPTPQEIMRMHVLEQPPDPREFVPELSRPLCSLLAKAMAREPEDRYQDAQEFIDALDQLDLAALDKGSLASVEMVSQLAGVAKTHRHETARAEAAARIALAQAESAALRIVKPHRAVKPGRMPKREARTQPAMPDGQRAAGKKTGLMVGLVAFGVVLVVGLVVMLVVFGFKPPVEDSTPPKPRAPFQPVVRHVTPHPLEKNAQAALEQARNLETMPNAWRGDIIKAYENIITFYPETEAAEQAQVALYRLGRSEIMRKPPPPEPGHETPQPKPPEPQPKPPEPPPEPPKPPEPEPTEPAVINVHARHADINGPRPEARYETAGDRDNIGFWLKETTWVSWDITIDQPGTYQVQLTYAHDKTGPLGKVEISVGPASVVHALEGTGDWGKFVSRDAGTLEIPQAGPTTLAVRVATMKGNAVMNLQSIRLTQTK